ncbi:MAG TPA: helix-turn-helix transcriptional regulator [Candidatus Obscuribacter sp.]|nr:helix-turn-helix transcriptional regulator [Candidatus Obscuribacter sp.]
MKLNKKHLKILELLSGGEEWYGLDLIAASNGILRRGVVYISLRQLEEGGLIESRLEPKPVRGTPRRLYRLAEILREV